MSRVRLPVSPATVIAVGAALAVAGRLPAQLRTMTPITTSLENHTGAVVSPDGTLVAFRGTRKIAAVPYATGSEYDLATGSNLGSFLWTRNSSGIYYVDNREVSFVPRNGGTRRIVQQLAELDIHLHDITGDGSLLYGTWLFVRNGGTVRRYEIWTLPTDGSAPPTVIDSSVLTLDGVRLSPDERLIAFREYLSQPFAPRDFVVANANGSNRVSLTGSMGLPGDPGVPWWDATNAALVYGRLDFNLRRPVVERIDLGGAQTILTAPITARQVSASEDGRWVVYEGTTAADWSLLMAPTDGGGHVFLDPSRPLLVNAVPRFDDSGRRIVVSGTLGAATVSQVLKVETARELYVHPRAEIGTTITADLPVAAGETGLLLMAAGLGPGGLAIPGIVYALWLDPGTLLMLAAGVGDGQNPIRASIPVPNVQILRGRTVAMQGLRVTSFAPTGDFTRYALVPIF